MHGRASGSEVLRTDPLVAAALDRVISEALDGRAVGRETFFCMNRKMYLVLCIAGGKEPDPAECAGVLERDWAEDSCGRGFCTAEQICASWFELAEMHTRGTGTEGCVEWIVATLDAISSRDLAARQRGLLVREWRSDDEIMALHRGLRVSASCRLRWTAAFELQQQAEADRAAQLAAYHCEAARCEAAGQRPPPPPTPPSWETPLELQPPPARLARPKSPMESWDIDSRPSTARSTFGARRSRPSTARAVPVVMYAPVGLPVAGAPPGAGAGGGQSGPSSPRRRGGPAAAPPAAAVAPSRLPRLAASEGNRRSLRSPMTAVTAALDQPPQNLPQAPSTSPRALRSGSPGQRRRHKRPVKSARPLPTAETGVAAEAFGARSLWRAEHLARSAFGAQTWRWHHRHHAPSKCHPQPAPSSEHLSLSLGSKALGASPRSPRQAKAARAPIALASLPNWQRTLAADLLDAGGHHPHPVQGTAVARRAQTAESMSRGKST